MAKDAVATMGEVLPDDVGGRDAVHVAVIAVRAATALSPGQRVGVERKPDGEYVARVGSGTTEAIGIVDPFLDANLKEGERFWLYLYPRSITSLAHRWTHPAFADNAANTQYSPPSEKLVSEQWLKDFCAHADCPGFHAVMGKAEHIADGGSGSNWDDEYMHFDGMDAHGEIPEEFWRHVEIVLGRPIIGTKATYFSCSC